MPDAERPGEMLKVPLTQGRAMNAYLVLPAGDGPFPGVVVIHEILGLNDNIRDVAQRFASERYAALDG
jgi:carboxymethylenebutenolidase